MSRKQLSRVALESSHTYVRDLSQPEVSHLKVKRAFSGIRVSGENKNNQTALATRK